MAVVKPPNRNLSDAATPWGRWVENSLASLDRAVTQQADTLKNTIKSVNSTIAGLTAQTVTFTGNFQEGFNNVSYTRTVTANGFPTWATTVQAQASVTVSPTSEPSGSSVVNGNCKISLQFYDSSIGGVGWVEVGTATTQAQSDPATVGSRTVTTFVPVTRVYGPYSFTNARAVLNGMFFGGTYGGGGMVEANITLYANR